MSLEECLPPALRGPDTRIAPITVGLSGAGVFRVDAGGRSYVLKIARQAEGDADWRRTVEIQRAAARAGLTPEIVHVDETRRAVMTAFVVDRVFPGRYLDPRTHEAAVTELGRAVQRIHQLPVPAGARVFDPREWLVQLWAALQAGFVVPDFTREAVARALSHGAGLGEGWPVLGHNDLNPSNLLYDGETLLILDWSTAGRTDPFVDLATLAVFLRMDEPTCRRLLAAYHGEQPAALPERFARVRRLMAALLGTMMLRLARGGDHAGASGAETLASTLSLADFYQRLRAGTVTPATAEGQWLFGLALLKESLALP
jgi:aminoglycoside phosphotransferase (APT) family kinase protein